MPTTLGQFLRQLRQGKGLSQSGAAQAAGLGRVTLNRWETDTQKPRLPELEALLKVLAPQPEEHQRALSFLDPSRSANLGRIDCVPPRLEMATPPRPGHLLRALRLRRKVSQEEAASKLGIATRTLRRWEASEVEPTPTQLHDFCFALGVSTTEMMVLTTGRYPAFPDLDQASLEELLYRANHLFYFTKDREGESLRELGLLLIEMRVWPLAVKSVVAQSVLSNTYSFHAELLSVQHRYAESGDYAHRAIELWPREYRPNRKLVMAGITSAMAVTYKGARPAPKVGIETPSHWETAARWPEYQAWLLSDTAKFMSGLGAVESGLELVKQSIGIAERSANLQELHNRELDMVRLLLVAGKAGQALDLTQVERPGVALLHAAQFHLLGAEACLMLEKPVEAEERLQAAMQIIEERSLNVLRPTAQELSARL